MNFRYMKYLNLILAFIFAILFGTAVLLTVSHSIPPDKLSVKKHTEVSFEETVSSEKNMTILEYTKANDLSYDDYPQSLINLLERNPETETFVLEYPIAKNLSFETDLSEYETDTVPLFMQWDQRWGYIRYGEDVAGLTACGPVCLSMVAYYLTGNTEFTPKYMMDFSVSNGYCIPGDGTSWTLISEGSELLGLDATEIPLDENRIIANLEVQNPIICAMGPGDFTSSGHYVVMVGYENGNIQIHDPNSYANSEALWTYKEIANQIENLWVIRSGS